MALPIKLSEALALGCPVLAIASPGSDTARLLERLGQDAGLARPATPRRSLRRSSACSPLLRLPSSPRRCGLRPRPDAARYAALLDEVATRSERRHELRHHHFSPVERRKRRSRPRPSDAPRSGSRRSARSAAAAPSALPSQTIPATPSTSADRTRARARPACRTRALPVERPAVPRSRRAARTPALRRARGPCPPRESALGTRHLRPRATAVHRRAQLGAPITSSVASGSSARTCAKASSRTSIRLIGCESAEVDDGRFARARDARPGSGRSSGGGIEARRPDPRLGRGTRARSDSER